MRSDDDIFNVRSVGDIALWMLFSLERLVQMTSNLNMTSRKHLNVVWWSFALFDLLFSEKQQNTSLKQSIYNGMRRIGVTLVIKMYGAFVWL